MLKRISFCLRLCTRLWKLSCRLHVAVTYLTDHHNVVNPKNSAKFSLVPFVHSSDSNLQQRSSTFHINRRREHRICRAPFCTMVSYMPRNEPTRFRPFPCDLVFQVYGRSTAAQTKWLLATYRNLGIWRIAPRNSRPREAPSDNLPSPGALSVWSGARRSRKNAGTKRESQSRRFIKTELRFAQTALLESHAVMSDVWIISDVRGCINFKTKYRFNVHFTESHYI